MKCNAYLSMIFLTIFLLLPHTYTNASPISSGTQSVIIEVEGDPKKHLSYFKIHHPSIEIIATYDILFNGLALKIPINKSSSLSSIDFIKAIHPVQTYEANNDLLDKKSYPDASFPSDLNQTVYTGKGVKVAVIDTGIDYNHPDIIKNYRGGYDVVDLDDDPMETLPSEGLSTIHGTHVAGIIAADGKLKGVATDSDIYAYRALGPGGRGTTVQIIAAMEQAIIDGVDIMNLSLGNTVNGPDYPTSIAVNQAIDLGVAVVIANGNNGPENWTVGSPATASKAFSVGAVSSAKQEPVLYHFQADKQIPIMLMNGSVPWSFQKDYQVVTKNDKSIAGKIVLLERDRVPFSEKAKQAEESGAVAVLIYNNEEGDLHGSIQDSEYPINIPVSGISKESGAWLKKHAETKDFFISTAYNETKESVAPFSSRGPVAINWQIKPDVLAPGTNILSTIPGNSYQTLQGTSMAAPYVTGAMAVIKEAKPHWSNLQIIGALKTTALQLKKSDGQLLDPIEQGAGEISIDKAIDTKTIITNSLLTFEKITGYKETKVVTLNIENLTTETQTYYFDIPKKQRGMNWKLPQSFAVNPGEVKDIRLELDITTSQIDEGLHQGWLTLNQSDEKFHIPYLFINKTTDVPTISGFDFSLKQFSKDVYSYQVHVAEEVNRVDVHLYDPDTLVYEGELITLNNLEMGINEGQINKNKIKYRGLYKALLSIELENGTYDTYETDVFIE